MHRPPHAATQCLLKCISLRYCCQKRSLIKVTLLYHICFSSADLTDEFCSPLSVWSSSPYLQSSYGSLMMLPEPCSSVSLRSPLLLYQLRFLQELPHLQSLRVPSRASPHISTFTILFTLEVFGWLNLEILEYPWNFLFHFPNLVFLTH